MGSSPPGGKLRRQDRTIESPRLLKVHPSEACGVQNRQIFCRFAAAYVTHAPRYLLREGGSVPPHGSVSTSPLQVFRMGATPTKNENRTHPRERGSTREIRRIGGTHSHRVSEPISRPFTIRETDKGRFIAVRREVAAFPDPAVRAFAAKKKSAIRPLPFRQCGRRKAFGKKVEAKDEVGRPAIRYPHRELANRRRTG